MIGCQDTRCVSVWCSSDGGMDSDLAAAVGWKRRSQSSNLAACQFPMVCVCVCVGLCMCVCLLKLDGSYWEFSELVVHKCVLHLPDPNSFTVMEHDFQCKKHNITKQTRLLYRNWTEHIIAFLLCHYLRKIIFF